MVLLKTEYYPPNIGLQWSRVPVQDKSLLRPAFLADGVCGF